TIHTGTQVHRQKSTAWESRKQVDSFRSALWKLLDNLVSKSECRRFVHMPPRTAQNLYLHVGVRVLTPYNSIYNISNYKKKYLHPMQHRALHAPGHLSLAFRGYVASRVLDSGAGHHRLT